MIRRTYVVVGAAPEPGGLAHYRAILEWADGIVAADAGLAVCLDAGVSPDVCVGDFDSVPPALLERAVAEGIPLVRHPIAKDVSDLDLAIDVARQAGASEIVLVAAFSSRLDHTLAALGSLAGIADVSGRAVEPAFSAYSLDARSRDSLDLSESAGRIVSLFTIGDSAVVSTEGLKYPLRRSRVGALSSFGLSNEAVASVQRVTVHQGRLLVVVPR